MSFLQLFNYFSAILLVTTGLILVGKRRVNSYTFPFILTILINLIGIAAILMEIMPYSRFWNIGYYLLFLYISFFPSLWYFMACRWGLDREERHRRGRILCRLFFAVSAALFICLSFFSRIDITLVDGRWFLDLGEMSFWISSFIIITITTGMYSMETCYRSSLGLSRERIKRSFFPLLANGIGYLAMATVAMLYHQVSDWILTLIFLLVAMVSLPLARHYILFNPPDNGIIITKKGLYSSIVVVLVGIYFLIIGTVGELLVKYNLDDGIFYSVTVLILVVITFIILVGSQAIRSRLKAVAGSSTRIGGRGVYAAEWKEFSEEISVILDLDSLYKRTSRLLHRILRIEQNFIVIKEPSPSENYTLYSGDIIDRGISDEKLQALVIWLHRFGRPIETSTLLEKAPREAEELKALEDTLNYKTFLLVPFIARQQMLGFWGIGMHNTGRGLSSDEIGFIEAAANPVALTILGSRITDELVISREIESFHRISSFILHDLKNSVGMLSMLLQNAEKRMDNPEFQREALVTITRAVDRQKKIISRLTQQESDYKLIFEKADPNQLIRKALDRVKIDTLKTIELILNLGEGLTVIVDHEKVGSVFDNLIMNAVEAMPNGGRLTIGTFRPEKSEYVIVSFKDSGEGMDDEFISTRLYKPFSSTKPYGLGIGMYQSREIIKAHRGRLEVRSKPGEGAEFTVYLPGEVD